MKTTKINPVQPHQFTHDGTEVLILRRIPKDRKAHGGFIYPVGVGAIVTAPDWNTNAGCGGGLHGWPWSFGLGEGQDFSISDDIWLIMGALPSDVIGELGTEKRWKCKCRTATIRFEGGFKEAMDLLRPGFTACVRGLSSGDSATNASSGNSATNASSGDYATNASSGYYATNASSGDYAKNASSGNSAKNASSGYGGTIEAKGENSTAAAANEETEVCVGVGGAFALACKEADGTWRFFCGKAGENGIKSGTWYRAKNGKIEEVSR